MRRRGAGRRPTQGSTRLDADPDAAGTLLAVVLPRWRTLVRTVANRYHLLRLPRRPGTPLGRTHRLVVERQSAIPVRLGRAADPARRYLLGRRQKLARISRSRARSFAERAPARGWRLRYRLP